MDEYNLNGSSLEEMDMLDNLCMISDENYVDFEEESKGKSDELEDMEEGENSEEESDDESDEESDEESDDEYDRKTREKEQLFKDQVSRIEAEIAKSSECIWAPKHKMLCIQRDELDNMKEHITEEYIPVFNTFVVTVYAEAFFNSAYFGGDIFTTSKIGAIAAFALGFHGLAFSSTRLGTSRKVSSGPLASMFKYECRECELNGIIFPKVRCYIELLTNDAENFSPSKLLHTDNVKGFRVWYFFTDPLITPQAAILRQIEENARNRGENPRMSKIKEDGTGEDVELFDSFGDPMKYISAVSRHNRRVESYNKERDEKKEEADEKKAQTLEELGRLITTRTQYYNAVVVPIHKDKEEINEASDESVRLEKADIYSEKIKQYIYSLDYGTMSNEFHLEKLKELGVCDIQRNPRAYFKEEYLENSDLTGQQKVFSFPVPKLVFQYDVSQMHPAKFEKLRFPWKVSFCNLFLDYLEEDVQKKKEEKTRELNRKIFDSMNPVAANTMDMLTEHRKYGVSKVSKRKRLDRDYFEETALCPSLFNKRMNKETLAKERDHIVKYEDDIDIQFKFMRKLWFRKINMETFITLDQKRYLEKLLKQEGMDRLVSVFQEGRQLTPVCAEAVKVLLKLEREEQTAFIEEPCIPGLGVVGSYFAIGLLDIWMGGESMPYYQVTRDIYLSVLRASHCHITDEDNGMNPAIEHICNFGDAATGKSRAVEDAQKCMLKYAIQSEINCSERSKNTYSKESGTAVFNDEMGKYDAGNAKSIKDKMAIDERKTAMTSFVGRYTVFYQNQDKNGMSTARDRGKYTIETPMHQVVITNTNSKTTGQENSFDSRFKNNFFCKHYINQTGSMSTVSTLSTVAKQRFRKGFNKKRQEKGIQGHALHFGAAKAIQLKGLDFPDIEMLCLHWSRVFKKLCQEMPSLSSNGRVHGLVTSRGLVEVIQIALYMVFRCPSVSELVHWDSKKKTITVEPFNMRQLSLINKYLFLPEDAAIHIITQYVHTELINFHHYMFALWMANNVCAYYTKEQIDLKIKRRGNEPTYKKIYINDNNNNNENAKFDNDDRGPVETVDYNWLRFDMTRNQFYSAMSEFSSNKSIIENLKNKLCGTYINAKDTGSRFAFSLSKEEYKRCPDVVQPAMSIVESANMSNNVCTYLINVQYLERFSPDQVLTMVLDTLQHDNFRAREVLVGVPYQRINLKNEKVDIPFLYRKVSMKPNPCNEINIKSDTEFMDKIFEAAAESCKLTKCNISMLKKKLVNLEELTEDNRHHEILDLETKLCDIFLRDTVGIRNRDKRMQYTPKFLDEFTKGENTLGLRKFSKVMSDYPNSVAEEYIKDINKQTKKFRAIGTSVDTVKFNRAPLGYNAAPAIKAPAAPRNNNSVRYIGGTATIEEEEDAPWDMADIDQMQNSSTRAIRNNIQNVYSKAGTASQR